MNFKKMTLNINGADRTFICDPERDTLADVIRRLGLTGTKIGCGMGACGACSVILNGDVVKACVRKIAKIEEYSTVLTVEGIGSPRYLHPLQYAFMHYGAVQCGFCIPGFIVSAYALLEENNNPTREEVRDWFQKKRNICRCTGYKQIVDAVMAAAKVVRGECALEDIKADEGTPGNYYGKALVRPAALAKVCGVADYGDDIALKMPEGTLHAVMVQPKVAHHAKILNLDISEAEKMPGVYKVVTHKDVIGTNRLTMFQFTPRGLVTEATHILLQEDKIHNYGDCVAIVVAYTKQQAKVAAEKIKIEIEPLEPYLSYLEAVKPEAERIHPSHPNEWAWMPVLKGAGVETREIIDNAPFSVEGSFYSQREPHMSIEGDAVQAYMGADGKLTVQCKTMCVFANLADISEAAGVDMENLRVIENPTGGSFGWAIAGDTYSLAAITCIACDYQPVALHIEYSQFMAYSGKRAPAYSNSRLACDENGKIIGAEWDFGYDHGAYDELGDSVAQKAIRFTYFPYNVPNAVGLARVATSNHSYGTAYRGYGAPQAYTCSEAMIDMLAEKIGMDPFEFRWRNIAREGDLNLNSIPYLEYPMEEIMKKMKPLYEKACKEAKEADTPQKRRGVGLACGGYNVTQGSYDQCEVAIEIAPNGKFIKYDTWQDQGQGGDVGSLVCTLEALKELNVSKDDILLRQNDSAYGVDSGATAASRQHFMNTYATKDAADKLLAAMRKEDGTYRTYEEMVEEGLPLRYEGLKLNLTDESLSELSPDTGIGNPTPAYNYGLFMAEVEVDTETGKTTVLKFTSVDDVGKIGNIAALNGQGYGGLSHCIGFALSEEYEDVKKHNNIINAGIPLIKDIPDDMELHHLENARPTSPFGSSGASELYQSGAHMAVINAINNATGVRIYELPARPEKVKAGLEKLARGEKVEPPKKYFLGSDLYEEMEKIANTPMEDLMMEGMEE